MLVRVHTAKCIGIDAVEVTVEVSISVGIGCFIVGLADTAIKESLLRTSSALESFGFRIPGKKIVINLAPANLHKSGSGYDLPIAVGIIAASGQREFPHLEDYLIMGELGLSGEVRPIPAALIYAELARSTCRKGIILPRDCAVEAIEIEGISVFGVQDIGQALSILEEKEDCSEMLIQNHSGRCIKNDSPLQDCPDFEDIIGQAGAKRGMEIAAAGAHNVIMVGPPGSGKTTLAKALPGILPPLTREEATLTRKIYSIAGKKISCTCEGQCRPFRSPHYSASLNAIIGGGGGDFITPGEVSLAQGGVLFLDEFAQMPKSVIEALRSPLEDRTVTISRLRSKVTYPASFMLVAASNPCPCGYWGDGDKCICSPSSRLRYLSKLSGPIMDRIDIQLMVSPIGMGKIINHNRAENSCRIAERVKTAREVQSERFSKESIFTNSEMSNRQLERYCPLDDTCRALIEKLSGKYSFSMRAIFRIIKVARTIADLAGCGQILPEHLLEAAGYRFLDRRNENF